MSVPHCLHANKSVVRNDVPGMRSFLKERLLSILHWWNWNGNRRGRQTARSAAIGGTPVTTGRRGRRGRRGHLDESVGGGRRPVRARRLLLFVDVLRHRARTKRSLDARTTHGARHGRGVRTPLAAYTGVAPQRPRTLRLPPQSSSHAAPSWLSPICAEHRLSLGFSNRKFALVAMGNRARLALHKRPTFFGRCDTRRLRPFRGCDTREHVRGMSEGVLYLLVSFSECSFRVG